MSNLTCWSPARSFMSVGCTKGLGDRVSMDLAIRDHDSPPCFRF